MMDPKSALDSRNSESFSHSKQSFVRTKFTESRDEKSGSEHLAPISSIPKQRGSISLSRRLSLVDDSDIEDKDVSRILRQLKDALPSKKGVSFSWDSSIPGDDIAEAHPPPEIVETISPFYSVEKKRNDAIFGPFVCFFEHGKPNRIFIRESILQKRGTFGLLSQVALHLFSDALCFSKISKANCRMKRYLHLKTCRIAESDNRDPTRLEISDTVKKIKPISVNMSSIEERKSWVHDITVLSKWCRAGEPGGVPPVSAKSHQNRRLSVAARSQSQTGQLSKISEKDKESCSSNGRGDVALTASKSSRDPTPHQRQRISVVESLHNQTWELALKRVTKRAPALKVLSEKDVLPKSVYTEFKKARAIEENRMQNDLENMRKGDFLWKYDRRGRPKKLHISILNEDSELVWSKTRDKLPSVELADAKMLVMGPLTEAFQQYDKLGHKRPWLCFSVVMHSKEFPPIGFECLSQQQFNTWFQGLQRLIPLSHSKHISYGRMLWVCLFMRLEYFADQIGCLPHQSLAHIHKFGLRSLMGPMEETEPDDKKLSFYKN